VSRDDNIVDSVLSTGLIAYVSGGSRPYPTRDDAALLDAVGEDTGIELLPRLHLLVDESEELSVEWFSISREPWQQVVDQMRARHPELTEEALDALGRYWSYQMK
jgi:hypothetical protein